MSKIGRNEPCPCGSGKKYKKCCMNQAALSLPKVATASGEELSFHQARYDLLDREEALSRFEQVPDFDTEAANAGAGDISIAWLETGESARLMQSIPGRKMPSIPILSGDDDGPMRLLGDVQVKGSKLTLNAMGQQRFELGKKRLQSLLDGVIKHRLDSIQSMASAMAETSPPGLGGLGLPEPAAIPAIETNDPKFAPLGPGETINQALKNRHFESIEEANYFAQKAMGDYNNQPQSEMGGLSPLQVGRLLKCDWDDSNGPIRLNPDLGLHDLKEKSPTLALAAMLLNTCHSLGGIKATQAGYLNTTFVLLIAANMLFSKDEEEQQDAFIAEKHGRFKELDFHPLHLARTLCEFAGLIDLQKGRFRVTQRGIDLLEPENAGKFYKELFLCHLRELDLDAMDPEGISLPSIQHTQAFSLYAMSRMPVSRWQKPSYFYDRILLPATKQEVGGSEDVSDWSEDDWWQVIEALDLRLMEPLRGLGLIEERGVEMADSEIGTFEVRTTSLFHKFISFCL